MAASADSPSLGWCGGTVRALHLPALAAARRNVGQASFLRRLAQKERIVGPREELVIAGPAGVARAFGRQVDAEVC